MHMMSDAIYGAPRIHAELRDVDVADHDSRWATVGENRACVRTLEGANAKKDATPLLIKSAASFS
jgi:hypothetical protein